MDQNEPRVFLQRGTTRLAVPSLEPFLASSLASEHRMDPERMAPEDRRACRWLGYGIGKGVTHPKHGLSVFAVPETLVSGLHGELVQGFGGIPVDPTPACYEPGADPGFGGFIRWVLFADPGRTRDILGIDFSLGLQERAGVANAMLTVAATARTLRTHGIPAGTEVVLLDAKMREPTELGDWRAANRLISVADWSDGLPRFLSGGNQCPRCGLQTLDDPHAIFCARCGCRPALLWTRSYASQA